ncbi:Heat shock factor protein [Erysiphe necator]|nr:Heat shock factor protein [Erysiphe necator]
MPPKNPRKRSASGVFSVQPPMLTQSLSRPENIAATDFIKWTPDSNEIPFPNPPVYNSLRLHKSDSAEQASLNESVSPLITQLARRPINHQLMQSGQAIFNNPDDSCPSFRDGSLIELPHNHVIGREGDNIRFLEEKAAIAKRDALANRKQIPPFVQKLSSFLEESRNTDLIRWSDRGDSFIVLDEDEFAKTLIPELFKHNNYASFVRQLNMYGFHKRVGLSDNSMKASERKNKSPSEYYNPYFKRGHQNLLWLISKPRGGNSKNKKKIKEAECILVESDDERDIEEVYGDTHQNSRTLSVGPETNSLQRRDVNVLHNQLAEIQQQQAAISNAIQRLRKDHNTLFQQSVTFQSLHDRHDNSINAILSFLATIYNRSLDGQSPTNIAQIFSNSIPHNEQQHPGSVVDIGDISNQQDKLSGSMSPNRRAQLLLMAPSSAKKRSRTSSSPIQSSVEISKESSTYSNNSAECRTVEEVFDSTQCGLSTSNSPSPISSPSNLQSSIISLINNTNAANPNPSTHVMQIPDMLSQYDNLDDDSSHTIEQQNPLILLTGNTSAAGISGSRIIQTPQNTPVKNLEEIRQTNHEIDNLLRLQIEQDSKIGSVKAVLGPLSPSTLLPNDQEPEFFNADLPNSNIDLDQFLDTDPYFSGDFTMPSENLSYEYEEFNENNNFSMDTEGSARLNNDKTIQNMVSELLPQHHEPSDK